MKKGHNRVTFKPYTMDQPALLPPTLDELVPKEHLVRVVNQTIEELNIDPFQWWKQTRLQDDQPVSRKCAERGGR